jgi:hypothetical protein
MPDIRPAPSGYPTQQPLDFHCPFRREKFLMTVNMRLEAHALFADLAQRRQGHHLKAAGVGQDRPLPIHEFVQAPQPRNALGAWPQHQVIGVAQQDIGAGLAHTLRQHRLDGARCSNRHEGRRADVAARGADHAQPRCAVHTLQFKCEPAHCARNSKQASP